MQKFGTGEIIHDGPHPLTPRTATLSAEGLREILTEDDSETTEPERE